MNPTPKKTTLSIYVERMHTLLKTHQDTEQR